MTRIIDRWIFALSALMSSLCLLVMGSSLLNTILSLRAHIEGIAVEAIGLMGTMYFSGYVLGCIFIPRIVLAVGHIRAFAGLAAIASAVSLTYLLWVSAVPWFALRAVSGFCYAGMIVVVEGWLNGTAKRKNRGKVLAAYSIIFTSSWAVSQQFLKVSEIEGFALFLIVGMLLSLALVPITLTKTVEPGVVTANRVSVRSLYRLSPMGLAGSVMAGLSAGSFIGLGPVYAVSLGHGPEWVSSFMSLTILGALALHWPVGWLSDRHDRRQIIILVSSVSAIAGILLSWQAGEHPSMILFLAFLYGASSFSLYVLCVAHIGDLIKRSELIPVVSQLILMYGLGAITGPLIGGLMMGVLGPRGLFAFTGAASAGYVYFCVRRLRVSVPPPEEEKKPFVPVPRTTHAILELLRKHDPWFGKRKQPE